MLKRAEMSYALLTCCLALVPRWEMLDEAVVTTLRSDVWANRVARLESEIRDAKAPSKTPDGPPALPPANAA